MPQKKAKLNLKRLHIANKKALFDYELLQTYTAGLVLKGSEVKSIRMGRVNLQDAFCFFKGRELWVKGMHVSHYQESGMNNHPPTRVRKILLKARELRKLQKGKAEKDLPSFQRVFSFILRGSSKWISPWRKGKSYMTKEGSKKSEK